MRERHRTRTLRRGKKYQRGKDICEMGDVVAWLICSDGNERATTRGKTLLTSSIKRCMLRDIYNIRVPLMSCMGMIQDFRRPKDEKKTESTTGDHSNFSEYGYPDSANVAS